MDENLRNSESDSDVSDAWADLDLTSTDSVSESEGAWGPKSKPDESTKQSTGKNENFEENPLKYLKVNLEIIALDEKESKYESETDNKRPRRKNSSRKPSNTKNTTDLGFGNLNNFIDVTLAGLNNTESTLKAINEAIEKEPLLGTTANHTHIGLLQKRCDQCINLVETIREESQNPLLVLAQLPVKDHDTLRRIDWIINQEAKFCNAIALHLAKTKPKNRKPRICVIISRAMKKLAHRNIWNRYSIYKQPRFLDDEVDEKYVFVERKGILKVLYKTCLLARNDEPVPEEELRIAIISFFKRNNYKRIKYEKEKQQNKKD